MESERPKLRHDKVFPASFSRLVQGAVSGGSLLLSMASRRVEFST